MSLRQHAVLTTLCICLACTAEPAPVASSSISPSDMPKDVVARVGATDIQAESVAHIAAAKQIPLIEAQEIAVRDALFVNEAKARQLDRLPQVRQAITSVLARRMLHQVFDDAAKLGPVTDQELQIVTQRHWLELDRPEAFRTVHAVVRLSADADPATIEKARAVAQAIYQAIEPVRSVAIQTNPPDTNSSNTLDPAQEAFQQAARAVPTQGFEIIVQPLSPVTASGRTLTVDEQHFDPEFTRAASSLAARGDISPLVTSAFGIHVLMLLERIPGHTVPDDERRHMVRDEVLSDRARAAQAALLQQLRRDVAVVDSLDTLLALVRIEP